MFARIRRQKLKRYDGHSLYVELVENHRVDGKVKQKQVMRLGRIFEHDLASHSMRKKFWDRFSSNLNEADLSSDIRNKILSKVESEIPKPDVAKIGTLSDKLAILKKLRGQGGNQISPKDDATTPM